MNSTSETLTQIANKLTYEQVVSVTQDPIFIFALLVIWLFPIVLYLLMAGSIKASTSSGRKLDKSMLSNLNAWIPVLIWTFLQAGLFLLLVIFPVWAF